MRKEAKMFDVIKTDLKNGMVQIQICKNIPSHPRPIVCAEALAFSGTVDEVTKDLLEEATQYFGG